MQRRQTYLDKQEERKNAMIAAGLLADRYPGVSSIELRMTYYQKTADPVLMKRTVNFFPANYALFRLDCMREECVNGGFDLAPVVAALVKGRKTSVKGNLSCRGKNDSLGHGHASIAYEISIQYSKNRKA